MRAHKIKKNEFIITDNLRVGRSRRNNATQTMHVLSS